MSQILAVGKNIACIISDFLIPEPKPILRILDCRNASFLIFFNEDGKVTESILVL